MDRRIVSPYEQYADTDVLKQNLYSYFGLSQLADAVIGNSTLLNRFACTPHSPADLTILVGHGEIYSLQNVDNTAYGTIPQDTANQIVKQGATIATTQLSCPAPGTAGFSVNYLVQIGFSEVDTSLGGRQFKDVNTGAVVTIPINQERQDKPNIQIKAGVAATTGTQATPSPDSGFVGAYIVTVANGQTTITSGNISVYNAANFISEKLQDKISLATGDARYLRQVNIKAHALQVFTTPGNFTVPVNTTTVYVTLAGGGGGGGGGAATSAGGGGGGGAVYYRHAVSVTPGDVHAIAIGAGGNGGLGLGDGAAGGISGFGALLSASGGSGGKKGNGAASGGLPGGPGGSSGQYGGAYNEMGGIGGSSFGGCAPNDTGTYGNNGINYGGGGSGAGFQTGPGTPPYNGGNGANGICIVEW